MDSEPQTLPKDDPRTWGNCIRLTDLPPVPQGQCEATEECTRSALKWKYAPSGGWYPMCFEHADYVAALDREWADAEAYYLEQF